MSGEDIGNVDAVQSEAQAIQRAEAFLAALPERRRQHMMEVSKRTGIALNFPYDFDFEFVYTLRKVKEYRQGWFLTYWREHKDVHASPPIEYVSVNRKTGETKKGHFWMSNELRV